METINIPPEVDSIIDSSEHKDFTVKTKRAYPYKKSLPILFFGIIWTVFSSFFVFAFLGPLFLGKEAHFTSNGVPVVASPDNLAPIIMPASLISAFILIGFMMIAWGIYLLTKKGGYFVGTPTRLIKYFGGNIDSINWKQFNGNIKIRGNSQNGSILLEMKTGRYVSGRDSSSSRYVPDIVYIGGIPNVYEIGKICEKRIKEANQEENNN